MIINVRGTCGSGKSSVVRAVLDSRLMGVIKIPGRKQPMGYTDGRLFIPGHYEIHMGGIDTVSEIGTAYDWIKKAAKVTHVLFEGKAQNRDVDFLLKLKKFDLRVIHLQVTIEDAINGVRTRPSATGIQDSLIARTWRKCERDADELEQKGVQVFRLPRDQAVGKVMELLK